VVSRTLHVDFGCSVEFSFSNMKNKKHFHIDLHLVHSPNAFKSHHCHVRTTVYSILLYHTLFSLQYRLPYYFEFFRFYDLHWSFEAAQFNLQFFNHHLYLKDENQFEPALSLLSHYCKLPIYQHPTAPFNVFIQRRFYLSSLSPFFFEINENLTMRNVATVCLKVSPVDVPPVWRLQAGHLPRARPDTSSSSLPLAPLQ
jgi:hypothetical protein